MSGLRRLGLLAFRGRLALVLVLAFLALAAIAGKTGGRNGTWALAKPSGANHYVHLAEGWLEGRLHLEGKPPGYRERRHDDWAQVYTLELKDGTRLRAYPCRTEGCRLATKASREETWWSLDDRAWIDIPRRDIAKRTDTWYVSFPPAPALLMLPGVAIWGLGFLDTLFTVFVAALIPVALVHTLDRVRGTDEGRWRQHLWASAAWALGSPACFVAVLGGVWFTAHVVGALFMVLYVSTAWDARRPALAGLCLGMAMACRPHLAFAVLLFGLEWWRCGRKPGALARFLAPLVLVGLALALHNYARFHGVFEFGHRFLDMRWQARMQEYGMFSTIYLARNLECLLWLTPQLQAAFPFIRVSIHGIALPLSTPWLLALFWARDRFPQRAGLWLAALAVAVPSLFYQNSGQVQLSYRFALDWLPLVLVALVLGGAAKRRAFGVLVVLAAVVHVYGAWMFAHRLTRILVLDPAGWPFETEFL